MTHSRIVSVLLGAAFGITLLGGCFYALSHLHHDLVRSNSVSLPFLMLAAALLIALGFEFVNGFHDTANAVATVIYSNSLPPSAAVIWSGIWNLVGVLCSSGAVAFTIISLLPIELILNVSSYAGFSMIFALLLAAIVWNLLTWYFGIPNSSSHTLIGSIIGIGLMNQMLFGAQNTSGVNWHQAIVVFEGLIFSPVAGFVVAFVAMGLCRLLVKSPSFYESPRENAPPSWPVRLLLILACTGVSFSHGSNDGQKGMGLIMLILIGAVPTAYALNGTVNHNDIGLFHGSAVRVGGILLAANPAPIPDRDTSRRIVTAAIQKEDKTGSFFPALRGLISSVDSQTRSHKFLHDIPHSEISNVRNDLYLIDHALPLVAAYPGLAPGDVADIMKFRSMALHATQFIPFWVKLSVALALGLGTVVGWKRIVITIGRRIGKSNMNYAQGVVAQSVAMVLIQSATSFKLPVSTTHALTSSVAGAMMAQGYGLQWKTLRNMVMAWVLTLPTAIVLSGVLFWLFRSLADSMF